MTAVQMEGSNAVGRNIPFGNEDYWGELYLEAVYALKDNRLEDYKGILNSLAPGELEMFVKRKFFDDEDPLQSFCHKSYNAYLRSGNDFTNSNARFRSSRDMWANAYEITNSAAIGRRPNQIPQAES